MTTVGGRARPSACQQAATIANVLKSMGYATSQFGKNHLGDRNEFLPTVHGFDNSSATSMPRRDGVLP